MGAGPGNDQFSGTLALRQHWIPIIWPERRFSPKPRGPWGLIAGPLLKESSIMILLLLAPLWSRSQYWKSG